MSSPQHHDGAPALANFYSLPYELRARIVKDFGPWRKTATTLMLVSRELYKLVAPELYQSLMIDKPSMLSKLVQTVVAKPALGRLIKELWLGPFSALWGYWWPLGHLRPPDDDWPDYDSERRSFSTSLEDEQQRPLWCKWRQSWSLKKLKPAKLAKLSCKDKAVFDALDSAQDHLNVDLRQPRCAPDGTIVGSTLWFIGVSEVQAALDLYLLEMRRLEDEAGISGPTCQCGPPPKEEGSSRQPCINYPPLVLTTTTASPGEAAAAAASSSGSRAPFFLHRSKLLRRVTRRDGKADSFDHPLLFARSGIRTIIFDQEGYGRLSNDLWREAAALYDDDGGSYDEELSDEEDSTSEGAVSDGVSAASDDDASPGYGLPSEDAFANLALPASSSAQTLATDLVSPLDQANDATTSIGGNLSLARTLLGLTPNLESLLLTGFLQRAICGKGAALPPPALRKLYLGPFSHHSDDSLSPCFEGERLRSLEELGIRGCFLQKQKRECLRALPRLKRVYWNLENTRLEPSSIIAAFRPLLGHTLSPETSEAASKSTPQKRNRADFEEGRAPGSLSSHEASQDAQPSADSAAEGSKPIICLSMNEECDVVLRPRLSAKAVTAWKEDKPFDAGPLRIRLWTQERPQCPGDCWFTRDLVTDEASLGFCDMQGTWEMLGEE